MGKGKKRKAGKRGFLWAYITTLAEEGGNQRKSRGGANAKKKKKRVKKIP